MSLKVLYIHQYFKTPAEGGGLRSYFLAKELVKNGIQVTMISAHNGRGRIKENVKGIDVIYLPVPYNNEMGFGQRAMAFVKFVILAMIESCRHRKIDICYIMTTPLTTGLVALFNKFILARPYIFEVGDLWPKVPIDMGLIKSGLWKRTLKLFERIFYRQATGLIGLSEPITDHIKGSAPKTPVQTIYNIADCSMLVPRDKDQKILSNYMALDKFVISYTGTFGIANDLQRLIELMETIQDLPVLLLMVGGGAERGKIDQLLKSKGLNNVCIKEPMSKEKIIEVLRITDVMFISFANVVSLHTGSPNKLFDALAAGKPVVTNFRGWVGDMIEAEECGFVADSAERFREILIELIQNRGMLKNYGLRARQLAEERFDLPIQSARQINFIRSLVS